MRRAPFARFLAGSAVLILAISCGSDDNDVPDARAQTADLSPEIERLIEAAEEEGELNLNWALNNAESMDSLVEAFKAAYGLDIDVTVTQTPNMPANLAQLAEENNAGRPASTDAFIGTQDFLAAGGPAGRDVFEIVDWVKTAPHVADYAVGDGVGVSLLDQMPGLAYNTQELSEDELPRTFDEVLDLEGPIASTSYAAGFNILSADHLLGRERIEEHLRALDPAGLIGCLELDRVASGEFVALWISCGSNIADIAAAEGAPIDTVVPTDAGIVQTWYMAVPKNAVNPHAAKLWISWLTTPEAQDVLFEHEFADNRLIEGSQTAEQIAELEDEGVSFTFADYDFTLDHPEVSHQDFVRELGGLLQGG